MGDRIADRLADERRVADRQRRRNEARRFLRISKRPLVLEDYNCYFTRSDRTSRTFVASNVSVNEAEISNDSSFDSSETESNRGRMDFQVIPEDDIVNASFSDMEVDATK